MYELDLGFNHPTLYRKCRVVPLGIGRYRLDTPLDSAVVIIATELLELLETIPKSERDRLVLTGAVPAPIYLTALAMLSPFFREVEHYDGKGTRVVIPQPPEHFDEQE